MRRCVIALACLCFLCPVVASAGPVRQWIKGNRPGVLIPKREGGCLSGQRCGSSPAPAPITDPGLDVGPAPNNTYVIVQTSGGYTLRPSFTAPSCSGGSCAPGGTYYTLPSGSCPGGKCPVR